MGAWPRGLPARPVWLTGATMSDNSARFARCKFRAWHRGTREADYMIGGFFDRYAATWSEDDIAWYEIVVEEDDVDIMAWALGTGHPPAHLDRPDLIAAMRRLDYIPLP